MGRLARAARLGALVEPLAERFQVITLDGPGHGASGPGGFGRGTRAGVAAALAVQADREIPYGEAQVLVEAWPKARLVTSTGLGRYRVLRDPVIIQTVTAFIAGTDTIA